MAFAIVALFAASGICFAGDRVIADRPLMGTSFRVIVEAENSKPLQAAIDAAFAKAALIEAACSDYREDSEVSVLSRLGPVKSPIRLSPELGPVLMTAQMIGTRTGGAYDPTLGALTKQWRQSLHTGKLLPEEERAAALSATGIEKFSCGFTDDGTYWLSRKDPGVVFDLGGIAKGYAADAMHNVLKEAGFASCAIIAGGDVRVGDAPKGKAGWVIGLRTMKSDTDDTTITLANAAVSTSGGLYQTVTIDGVNYSHIIDPKTGLGLTRPIAASVIAPTATFSDALATAACVVGPQRAVDEIEDWGRASVRVVTEENGQPKVALSKKFQRWVQEVSEHAGK